jgi:hypothetical protein
VRGGTARGDGDGDSDWAVVCVVSRTLRLTFALGLFAFAFGVGTVLDGSVWPGVGLLAVSVPLMGVPGAVFARVLRDRRALSVTLGSERRSTVADDPAFAPRFRGYGLLVVCLGSLFVLAAGATLAALYRSTVERGMSTAATVTAMIFSAVLAGIPAALGGRLLGNGLRLVRGIAYGAEVAVLMLRIVLILSIVALVLALADTSHPSSPGILRVAIPVVVACLVVNGLLKRFVRDVRAAEAKGAERARHAEGPDGGLPGAPAGGLGAASVRRSHGRRHSG